MKSLSYYLSLPYPIEIIPDEGGFIALLPDLPGCMSSGATVAEAAEGLIEAKELWIEGRLEQGESIPEPTDISDYSGKFVLRIPKSLHKSLDYQARKDGVSLNQHVMRLLSERNSLPVWEQSIRAAVECLIEKTARAYQNADPNWSWSEEAVPGRVQVFVSHHSKHDPLDLLQDIPGTPRWHQRTRDKEAMQKPEVFH